MLSKITAREGRHRHGTPPTVRTAVGRLAVVVQAVLRALGRTAPALRLAERLRRPLIGVLCGLSIAVLPAEPASAHAVLRSTSPAADAVVAVPPLEVALRFSEAVTAIPEGIRVIGPDGRSR
jgi:hypothetical protein